MSARVVQFVDKHGASASWRAQVSRVAQRFAAHMGTPDDVERAVSSATVAQLLDYCMDRFEHDRVQPSTISSEISAIDSWRSAAGLAPLGAQRDVDAFRRAVHKARPVGSKFAGTVPFAPSALIPHLLPVATFAGLRERAMFAGRVVTLARAGSFHTISRKSIRSARDLLGRPVVVLQYSSKGSAAAAVALDSNYLEHIGSVPYRPPSCRDRALCPACLMLDLRQAVERLPAAPAHDAVFTDDFGRPLSIERTRNLMTALMRRANLESVFTSHSLRAASSQTLQVLGVSAEDICLRAGWHYHTQNPTRSFHYTHNRFVRPNFADLLLLVA